MFVACITTVSAAPVFKSGDRVAICGDSITDLLQYSRYLQQYIFCRYPDMKIKFYTVSKGGETAAGMYDRLESEVFPFKPTIATLFFGMNDGGYRPVNDTTVSAYRSNMEKLVKALQARGIKVVIFSPGCVDYDRNPRHRDADYNKALEVLAGTAAEVAGECGCPYADIHHPMIAYQNTEKAADPKFTLMPDGVHPELTGQYIIASTMLQCLGVEPMPPLGEVDISSAAGNGLRIVSKGDSQVVLETTAPACVPYWFSSSNMTVMQKTGFINMAGQRLTVRGLAAGTYIVSVEGRPAGSFTSDQLAAGVMIAGDYSQKGRLVHDAIMYREAVLLGELRLIRMGMQNVPGINRYVDGCIANDDFVQDYTCRLAAPSEKSIITLIRKG
jgi:lysophospholipase L1-like esterase